jgi:hypothetical protein
MNPSVAVTINPWSVAFRDSGSFEPVARRPAGCSDGECSHANPIILLRPEPNLFDKP